MKVKVDSVGITHLGCWQQLKLGRPFWAPYRRQLHYFCTTSTITRTIFRRFHSRAGGVERKISLKKIRKFTGKSIKPRLTWQTRGLTPDWGLDNSHLLRDREPLPPAFGRLQDLRSGDQNPNEIASDRFTYLLNPILIPIYSRELRALDRFPGWFRILRKSGKRECTLGGAAVGRSSSQK